MSKINWQQPFVNIFKYFSVESDKNVTKSGDVTTSMDQQIKSKVFKISGHSSATNFITLPKLSGQSLGLTGRYIYFLFKPTGSKHFTFHIDVMTGEKALVRVSFSSMFKEFKSTPTWLQFPYVIQSPVDHLAGTGKDLSGAAPATTKWTVFCVDLTTLVRIYANRTFECVRGFKLCSSMLVKNVITSDVFYEPGVTYAEQKVKQSVLKVNAFPREVSYPCERGDQWSKLYDYVTFPGESSRRPFDSAGQSRVLIQSEPEPRRSDVKQTFTSTVGSTSVISHSAIDSATFKSRRLNTGANVMALNLPLVGVVDDADGLDFVPPEDAFRQNEQDIHVYPKSRPDSMTSSASSLSSIDAHPRVDIMTSKTTYKTSLEPDPILKLSRIIGFESVTSKSMRWTRDCQYLVYASKAIVICHHVETRRQFCFVGHPDRVSCVAISPDGSLVASGQAGNFALVRIWNFDTQRCLAIFRNHDHSLGLLEFSACGNYLCGVGKDKQGKTMLVIWDITQVGKNPKNAPTNKSENSNLVKVVAKAHTDTHISQILFIPYDSTRLISCGRDNIRFWRLKNTDDSIRSCAINLSPYIQALNGKVEEATDRVYLEFTDMALNSRAAFCNDNLVYACTQNGQIFVINTARMEIENVRIVEPIIERSSGGILVNKNRNKPALRLNSLTVSEKYCVTGSEDGYVRVWPLDFSQVAIEAEHESPVKAVRFSPDCRQIATATSIGNLGLLDIQSKQYSNLVRSHSDVIVDATIDSKGKFIVTCSRDSSVRVWSTSDLSQLYDFNEPTEKPTRVCFHPASVNDRTIFACGFSTGKIRLFNVTDVKLQSELTAPHLYIGSKNDLAEITDLKYTSDGKRLICADSLNHLSLFNSEREYSLVRVLSNAIYGRLALSPDDRFIAAISPSQNVISIFECLSLNEALRVNINCESAINTDLAVTLTYSTIEFNQLVCVTSTNKLLKFDAKTGRLLSSVNHIHRDRTDFVSVTNDGQYLITNGDNLIKIWDYQMRMDNNYQTFIGHSTPVNKIILTSDKKTLISVGDSIIIWDFLAYQSASDPGKADRKMPTHGRPVQSEDEVKVNFSVVREAADERKNIPKDLKIFNEKSFEEIWEADKKSKLKVNSSLPELVNNLALEQPRTPPVATQVKIDTISFGNEIEDTFLFDEMPRKEETKSYQTLPNLLSTTEPDEDLFTGFRPNSIKHVRAREKDSLLAKKRFAVAEPSKCGLQLNSVIGYNGGHAAENMVWNTNEGFLAFSVGSVVCVENLESGKQEILSHPSQEDVTAVCIKCDQSQMASASSVHSSFDVLPKCQIIIWDCAKMTGLVTLVHKNASNITCLKYSCDDRLLISISDYKCPSLVIWRAWDSSYSNLVFIDCLNYVINDIAWSPFRCNEFSMGGQNKSLVVCLIEDKPASAGNSTTGGLKFNELDVPLPISEQHCTNFEFTSLAYGNSGLLFAATNQGFITVWNTKTSTCFLNWRADVAEIGVLVCSENKLITGSTRGCLKLWNISNIYSFKPGEKRPDGLLVDSELQLSSGIKCCAFDDALETGFVATDKCTIWFINWLNESAKQNKHLVSSHTAKINSLRLIDDKYLSSVGDDGSLIIWSSTDRDRIFQVDEKSVQAYCQSLLYLDDKLFKSIVKYSKTSNNFPLIIVGYSDGSIRLYDIDKQIRVSKIGVMSQPITCVNYCEKTPNVIVGSLDGQISVVDLSQEVVIQAITDHKGAPITSLDSFYLDDTQSTNWLAASRDRRVSVWTSKWTDPSLHQILDWLTFPSPTFSTDASNSDFKYWLKYPPSLALFERSPRRSTIETLIYSGYGLNKEIIIYDFINKTIVRTLCLSEWPECLAIAPSRGSLVAIGTKSRLLQMKELKSGAFQDFALHSDKISSVCFSSDGRRLFSASYNEIFIWDVKV